MKNDREILFETACGETAAHEFGDAPMRQERQLQDIVGKPHGFGMSAEISFNIPSLSMPEHHEPDIYSRLLHALHRGEEGEGSFFQPELAEHAKIRSVAGKVPPNQIADRRIGI